MRKIVLRPGKGEAIKIEQMSEELSYWTGRNVIGGSTTPGGDEGIVRFDFDGELHHSINTQINQHGLKSVSWLNYLWIWK